MAKYIVKFPFSGWINGTEWPAVGEEIDLPEAAAEAMVGAGHLEPAKKPAKKAAAKKTAAKKPDEAEKRPASDENVEKR